MSNPAINPIASNPVLTSPAGNPAPAAAPASDTASFSSVLTKTASGNAPAQPGSGTAPTGSAPSSTTVAAKKGPPSGNGKLPGKPADSKASSKTAGTGTADASAHGTDAGAVPGPDAKNLPGNADLPPGTAQSTGATQPGIDAASTTQTPHTLNGKTLANGDDPDNSAQGQAAAGPGAPGTVQVDPATAGTAPNPVRVPEAGTQTAPDGLSLLGNQDAGSAAAAAFAQSAGAGAGLGVGTAASATARAAAATAAISAGTGLDRGAAALPAATLGHESASSISLGDSAGTLAGAASTGSAPGPFALFGTRAGAQDALPGLPALQAAAPGVGPNGLAPTDGASGVSATLFANPPSATAPGSLNLSIGTPLGDPGFGQEVARGVVYLVHSGAQSAELSLHPAELGPVHVDIQLNGQQAALVISASHEATRSALQEAIPQLQTLFAQNGLQLTGAQVGDGSQANNGRDPGQPRPGAGNDAAPDATTAGAGRGTASPLPALRRIGLVDTFA